MNHPVELNLTFTDVGDFAAFNECTRILKETGFSWGAMQGPAPIGVMFGEHEISKWRNMTLEEQASMHGTITGNKRSGPVTLSLNNAPFEAFNALTSVSP